LRAQLVSVDADEVLKNTQLTALARSEGRALFSRHCARCHGADMQGDRASGAPNLTDSVWLYDTGSVFEIERTVLYGVRSGLSKSHNVTDMPPFGLTGRLRQEEIRNLVQYLMQLSGQPHQGQASIQGRAVFYDVAKANCADCHADGGHGNPAYGAPDLTKNVWNSGGDAKSLYDAIYYGQHHIMPAFAGSLSLAEIRSLSVYVYLASHP
jgi:cytochrome c oxidase cbb3-type subunit 3